MFGLSQSGFIFRVRKEAHFHQHGWHFRRLQHDEAGFPPWFRQDGHGAGQFPYRHPRETGGIAQGFLAHQAQQYRLHLGRDGRQVKATRKIGIVFALREGCGERITRGLGQGIDTRPLRPRCGIGMERNQQRGVPRAGEGHAIREGDEFITLPRHGNTAFAAFLQFAAERLGGGKRQALFFRAAPANGARVIAAMAGVNYHQRQGGGAALRQWHVPARRRCEGLRTRGGDFHHQPPSRPWQAARQGRARQVQAQFLGFVIKQRAGDRPSRAQPRWAPPGNARHGKQKARGFGKGAPFPGKRAFQHQGKPCRAAFGGEAGRANGSCKGRLGAAQNHPAQSQEMSAPYAHAGVLTGPSHHCHQNRSI